MQVTAYKDLKSGRLFETEAELIEFQATQEKQSSAQQAQAFRLGQMMARRRLLSEELDSKEKFVELAKQIYAEAFESTPLREGMLPCKLKTLTVSEWRLRNFTDVELLIDIEVDGSPSESYVYEPNGYSPDSLLKPFSLNGGGGGKFTGGVWYYTCGLRANLRHFPKLVENLRRLLELKRDEGFHQQDVQNLVVSAQERDTVLKSLKQSTRVALDRLVAAQACYDDAMKAQQAQELMLAESVQSANDFPRKAELKELEEKTAFKLPLSDKHFPMQALVKLEPLLAQMPKVQD